MKLFWAGLFLFAGLVVWGIFPDPSSNVFIPPEPPSQIAEMVSHHHAIFEGPRSGKWPTVRQRFIAVHSRCAACGSPLNLNVHHLISFHEQPELELDPDNLITLCRLHHFLLGHSSNWSDTNENCKEAVKVYRRLHPWK